MLTLYLIAAIALVISFFFNREKTKNALKIGWKKFNKILGTYLKLLIILSFILLISDEMIIKYLGGHIPIIGLLVGLIVGSITMMPGFIAYPLAGILVDKGVDYMVVAGFVTSLMMVGVLTFPVEKEYFGVKGTIYRNVVSVVIAIIIAISTGIFYGELF